MLKHDDTEGMDKSAPPALRLDIKVQCVVTFFYLKARAASVVYPAVKRKWAE